MLKRLVAAIIVATMAVSTVPVMAEQDIVMNSHISFERSFFDDHYGAQLFAEDDPFLAEIVGQIAQKQTEGEKCSVVVDGLEAFNIDMTEKAQYIVDSFGTWVQTYNIMSAKCIYDKKYILQEMVFEIDNSLDTDEIAEIVTDKAAEKFIDPENYDKTEEVFTDLPLAIFANQSNEILAKVQFARPELCYILVNSVDIEASLSAKQNGMEFELTMSPRITFSYAPIKADEYAEFQKKLDDIVKEVVYPDMTDAQKAMALHDWIVDNVSYGYRFDTSIYSGKPDKKYHTIFSLDSYDTLMNLTGSDNMKESKIYAHTAYAPAMFGYGVCQGYTMLYAALLDKVGIENGTYISNTLNHQWSLLKIDDQWYYTDVTWDDPTPTIDGTKEGYDNIFLGLSDGSNIELYYQTEDYHNYTNFLMSEERNIDEGHTEDATALSIPDVECEDDKFHAVDIIGAEDYSHYAFDQVYYTKLNYSNYNKMYYYQQNVKVNGMADVWYYKLPFVLKNEDGTFTEPEKVTKKEFEAVIKGEFVEEDDKDDNKDDNGDNDDNDKPKDDYVTVQIPDETVIDNSVEVECKVDGEEGDSLTIENIGTAAITITQQEDAGETLSEVDAYLVYYGENNTIIDIIMKTVAIDGSGEIQFDGELPDDAVEAKIIVLDADSELVPVIKALGVTAEINQVPAS